MENGIASNRKLVWTTILIIIGILTSYIMQAGPSPILNEIRTGFSLEGRDSLLNLCVSIIYPFIISGSFLGNIINRKLGMVSLYFLSLVFLAAGMLLNLISTGYIVFLLGRCIFGIGFGLSIPFIGTAIATWYSGKLKDVMTTVNSMFPFVATLITYCSMLPLYNLFNGSYKTTLGIWGAIPLLVAVFWVLTVKEQKNKVDIVCSEGKVSESDFGLLKIKTIKQLSLIFICDFFYYSYLATILPTYLFEISHLSANAANIWSAVAFPLAGLLGAIAGGIGAGKLGKRKDVLVLGQILKFAGIMVITMGKTLPLTIIGVSVFGIGNGMWMPSMYSIPTDLPSIKPKQVGAIFALISAFGFVSGFVSPIIGGWLTNIIMGYSGKIGQTAHVFGMRWSLLIFNILNIISAFTAFRVRDPKQS